MKRDIAEHEWWALLMIVLILLVVLTSGCASMGGGGLFGWVPGIKSPDPLDAETAMKYRSLQSYHYVALALIVTGIFLTIYVRTNTSAGVISILGGVGLGLFAYAVPANDWVITLVLVGAVILGSLYLVMKLFPHISELLRRKPKADAATPH